MICYETSLYIYIQTQEDKRSDVSTYNIRFFENDITSKIAIKAIKNAEWEEIHTRQFIINRINEPKNSVWSILKHKKTIENTQFMAIVSFTKLDLIIDSMNGNN